MKINRGFTLIELLVVIAIIGLLSSVVLAALSSARLSARDAARQSDIKQIQNALELYRTANGVYPAEVAGTNGTYKLSDVVGLTPTYLGEIPTDPKPTNPNRYYRYLRTDSANYGSGASGYVLGVYYESNDVSGSQVMCVIRFGPQEHWTTQPAC